VIGSSGRRLRASVDGVGGRESSKPLTKRALRREFLTRHVDLDGTLILEVGALSDPMFPDPHPYEVSYLDWFDRDELIALHSNKPAVNVDAIVDVDYAIKTKRFAHCVSERFDLIIASHVIEHIADPITWLQQLGSLIGPSGSLFLSVPDRHFTFDYLRQPSTAVQLLRAYEEDLERADTWQVLDARYFHRPLKVRDFIDGTPSPEKLGMRRFDLRHALRDARKAAASPYPNANVHCFVYTPSSFAEIIGSLHEAGFVPWRIVDIATTKAGMNEFHVLLRRE
jgi:hypothetical protein